MEPNNTDVFSPIGESARLSAPHDQALAAQTAHISHTPYFFEALRPVGSQPTADQNAQLISALDQFRTRVDRRSLEVLEDYARVAPDSPWVPSVLLNVALAHLARARFSKARDIFRQLSVLAAPTDDRHFGAVCGRALAELTLMEARFGDLSVLKSLLDSCASRRLLGTACEIYRHAAGIYSELVARPEDHLRCGATALLELLHRAGVEVGAEIYSALRSTENNGISAHDLLSFSSHAGHPFELIRRAPGAPLRLPCIVHWRVGHYSALLQGVDDTYLVIDKIFLGSECAEVTLQTIDAESSGHFLVPAGDMMPGWVKVSESDARGLFGRGGTPFDDTDATSPYDEKHQLCEVQGMTVPSVHLMLVSLSLVDTPLAYSPPRGDTVAIRITYNDREAVQPSSFHYSNFGPRWGMNFIDFVTDSGPNAFEGMTVGYCSGGGGRVSHSGYEVASGTFRNGAPINGPKYPELKSQAILERTSSTSYQMRMPDGRIRHYTKAEPSLTDGTRRIFLTSVSDPHGLNALSIRYDPNFSGTRILALTDDLGFETTFEYSLASDPLKITAIADPYGRRALFGYTPDGVLLNSITDPLGLVSAFEYEPGTDLIRKLTTPYGDTIFAAFNADTDPNASADEKAHRTRWLTIATPDGEQERFEFRHDTPSVLGLAEEVPAAPRSPNPPFTSAWFQSRNTFHWSKKALHDGLRSYTDATIYHFLHKDNNTTSRILDSVKRPLESRIWFRYPGQTDPLFQGTSANPSAISRIVEKWKNPQDLSPTSATRTEYFAYNHPLGLMTRYIDPAGRETTYEYDSAQPLNLLFKRQTLPGGGGSFTLWSGTYYAGSRLLKTSAGPDGHAIVFEYTQAKSQLWRITYPAGCTVELSYDALGFINRIYLTRGGTRRWIEVVPDVIGGKQISRPQKITGFNGRAATVTYDAFDRATRITNLRDGSSEAFVYDRLNLKESWNRMQRVTKYAHDSNGQLTSVTDPDEAVTTYTWCQCGSIATIEDRAGNLTGFVYDIQGRMRGKIFPDGDQTTVQYYPKSGLLAFAEDRLYRYDISGFLSGWNHSNFTETTSIEYEGWIARPTAIRREVAGAINGQPRMTTTRTLTYYDQQSTDSALLLREEALLMEFDAYRVGTLATNTYDGCRRLARQQLQITEGASNSPFGMFRNFEYDDLGRLRVEENAVGTYQHEYDGFSSRLSSVTEITQRTLLTEYLWLYDVPRLSVIKTHIPAGTPTRLHSAVGFNLDGSLNLWSFQGAAGKHYWHTVQNDTKGRMTGLSYDNHVVRWPVDLLGNRRDYIVDGITQQHYSYNAENQLLRVDDTLAGTSATWQYLSRTGTPHTDGARSFDWYGTGSLMRVWYGPRGSSYSEFSYDEFFRLIRVREVDALRNTTRDTIHLWLGSDLSAVIDMKSKMLEWEFYGQGCRNSKSNIAYNWSRDHLGSVRELTTQDQLSNSRIGFQYSPWGMRTAVANSTDALPPVGFGGMFLHDRSGLVFSRYRVYDPAIGRWLSRDPLGEAGGLNLYDFVRGMPATFNDPTGLQPASPLAPLPLPTPPIAPAVANEAVASAAVDAAVGAGGVTFGQAILPVVAAFGVGYLVGTGINYFFEDAIQDALTPLLDEPTSPGQFNPEWTERRDLEHESYKDYCEKSVPSSSDPCLNAKLRAAHAFDCAKRIEEWDRRWHPGRHGPDITREQQRMANRIRDIIKYCPPAEWRCW